MRATEWESPWYDLRGWLGVKKQLSISLSGSSLRVYFVLCTVVTWSVVVSDLVAGCTESVLLFFFFFFFINQPYLKFNVMLFRDIIWRARVTITKVWRRNPISLSQLSDVTAVSRVNTDTQGYIIICMAASCWSTLCVFLCYARLREVGYRRYAGASLSCVYLVRAPLKVFKAVGLHIIFFFQLAPSPHPTPSQSPFRLFFCFVCSFVLIVFEFDKNVLFLDLRVLFTVTEQRENRH